jgi:hypothetical protein
VALTRFPRRHGFAGDWTSYERQQSSEFSEVPWLFRLVLVPDLDVAVCVLGR